MGRSLTNGRIAVVCDGHEEAASISPQPQMNERIVYLNGEVTESSISQVIAALVGLSSIDKFAPITLIVSTYGGSVDEMFSLYDIIRHLSCPVHTIGLGKVMSAGILLLASGKKGFRLVGKHARLMIHPISSGTGGTVFEMSNDTNEFLRQQAVMQEALVSETSMTRAQVEKIMLAGHDTYLTAKDAIKLGIVDKIIGE